MILKNNIMTTEVDGARPRPKTEAEGKVAEYSVWTLRHYLAPHPLPETHPHLRTFFTGKICSPRIFR